MHTRLHTTQSCTLPDSAIHFARTNPQLTVRIPPNLGLLDLTGRSYRWIVGHYRSKFWVLYAVALQHT